MMTMQIFSLLLVVAIFILLFGWVFWPSNRERFEAQARMILDQDQEQSHE